jgi:dihydropteroate synthase
MQRDPLTMQFNPEYIDVIAQVQLFLEQRASLLLANGVAHNRIVIDPGFGFGKSLEHNIQMLADFGRFTELGYSVLAGISRKSMLGKITGRDTQERLSASIAAVVMAADRGAQILRVHDVAETVDAIKLWKAIQND